MQFSTTKLAGCVQSLLGSRGISSECCSTQNNVGLLCLALQQTLKVDQSINQRLQLETVHVHVHMQITRANTAAFYSVSYTVLYS